MSFSEDPLAQGIYNFHFQHIDTPIRIHSIGFDVDEVLPSYFYRSVNDMPKLERQALDLCKGKVLDVGACAGCHSMALSQKGADVTALERSSLCCQVLQDRGLNKVICDDIFNLEGEKFDTILLLMNGAGISGTLSNFNHFLQKLNDLLEEGGQILMDSSDLIYLYMEEDGSALVDVNAERYYGELIFQTEYNNQKGQEFPWLYIDQELLSLKAEQNGLVVKQVWQGEHYDYLAQLVSK